MSTSSDATPIGDERLISFNEARKLFPRSARTGKPLDLCQLYRWSSRGIRGVRLRFIQAPGGRFTTRSAIKEFLAALTAAAGGASAPIQSPAQRRAKVVAAERRLAASGI